MAEEEDPEADQVSEADAVAEMEAWPGGYRLRIGDSASLA